MLIITSGLLLNVCVAAALIFPQKITTDHNNATKDSVNVASDEDPKEKVEDTMYNNSASFVAITLDIFKIPSACIMFVSTFLFFVGLSVVYTHVTVYAEFCGHSRATGTLMISCLGGSALMGRLVLSALCQQPCTNTVLLHMIAVFIAGKIISILHMIKNTRN